jgi:hypothetical protein
MPELDHQKKIYLALSRSAARHGSLAALQYLHGNVPHVPMQHGMVTSTSYNGHSRMAVLGTAKHVVKQQRMHIKILQWAHANGCPWDINTCAMAAKSGHLHVLQWAQANSCPWDSCTCAEAALNGHLDVLQWA